jgi:inner membrane protein
MESINAWLKPEIIWFAIGLVLLIMEFSAPGLIIAFFGLGAWLVAGTCLFIDISLTTQLSIFLITSILSLVTLRKALRKVFKLETIDNQNEEDEFIGQHAIVTKKINPAEPGKVEFKGADWEAESESELEVGAHVTIVARESIKFIVKPN